ncbi:hypothetical protein I7I51_04846 [Histoplasma capsulatum]|uniref:Uncharacterized protein n=1 Tax=Ajellomyces capsulatus TaxID=5037 RepID=A0A8A1M3X8_AJECA|nr:hypothetical protein I7I51_04846 [Histoplasma capsulatum]
MAPNKPVGDGGTLTFNASPSLLGAEHSQYAPEGLRVLLTNHQENPTVLFIEGEKKSRGAIRRLQAEPELMRDTGSSEAPLKTPSLGLTEYLAEDKKLNPGLPTVPSPASIPGFNGG